LLIQDGHVKRDALIGMLDSVACNNKPAALTKMVVGFALGLETLNCA
jgi:hypothetical protein